MKHHRHTRSSKEPKTALRRFGSRNRPSLARRPSNRSRFDPLLAARAGPVETIVHTLLPEDFPVVLICEDGTVMGRRTVTVVMDKYSRAILSWHMS